MGYYVRALPWKKSDPRWKLQFVSYKSQDTKKSKAIKAKKEWDVDPDRWRSLGFHKMMTLDEARVGATGTFGDADLPMRTGNGLSAEALVNELLNEEISAINLALWESRSAKTASSSWSFSWVM